MSGRGLYEAVSDYIGDDDFSPALWSFLVAAERRKWEDLADHINATWIYTADMEMHR